MTNHKDEAVDWLDFAIELARSPYEPASPDEATNLAQVHATLYLAEQQRIGNLIAYANAYCEQDEHTAIGSIVREGLSQ
jgi:hypothetical protein